MKKVVLGTDGKLYLKSGLALACPYSVTQQVVYHRSCGDWCPHFRVDETIFSTRDATTGGNVSRAVKVVRITCSGSEVGLEVVE